MKKILATCVLYAMTCGLIWAQGGATAQMHGTVRDATGAVVPGAAVKATQTETGVVRNTTSGADGGYVLANLPLGTYRVEMSKTGFTTSVQTGIVLTVGSDLAVDASLKIGEVSEQVVVEANAAQVETRSTAVGQLVETARILELPLNGRQPTDLITLSGAAVLTASTGGTIGTGLGGGRTINGAPIIQVAGGMSSGVGYLLDGANHFNYASATTNLMPFPDALQEFKVDTSGVNTQQGTYAQVSAVTRSGSNEFHGDAFEFVRNGQFNARNFFAPRRDDLRRNQFGGVIGGPIRKDKLFFFAGYQGTTVRSNNPTSQAFLPTPDMLAGNWTTYASPACNGGRQLNLGFPYINNTIDPATYNRSALNVINRLVANAPTPNQCGSVLFALPFHVNDHQFVGRADYQLSDKHSVFARYFAIRRTDPPASDLTNDLLASTNAGENDLMQSAVFGDTYVFSPNVTNSIRLSTTRLSWTSIVGPSFSGCDIGIKMYCGYNPQALTIIMGNAFTTGLNIGNGGQVETQNFNLNEDLSIVHGSHQFGIGANPRLDYMHQHDCFFCKGILVGSASITGSYLSDFLAGDAAVFAQAARFYDAARQWHWNLYASDIWKVNSRLTLSYGIRWEPFTPETLISGNIAAFDFARFQQGIRSKIHPDAPPGFTYPGDTGFPNGKKGLYNHWNEWAPRAGLAYDLTGDGKTSLRASYGLSYNQVGAHMHDDQTQQAPFINLINVPVLPSFVPGGGLSNPWAILGFNPHPGTVGTVPPFSELTAFPYDTKEPYTQTWNLSIQRQMGQNWLFSASYIGSETTHLWTEQPLNYAVVLPCPSGVVTDCNNIQNEAQRRILNLQNPGLNAGAILFINPSGTANYNGLLLSAQHRFSRNFSTQTNWTWSHCISDFDPNPTVQAGEDDYVWSNPLNRRFDRGPCVGDRRYIFNLTAAAVTPKYGNNVWGRLASDWQLAPIFIWQSGQPLDVVVSGDPQNPAVGPDPALNGAWDPIKGSSFQRANCIAGVNPYGSSGPGGQYLNPNAFSIPSPGTLGNCQFDGLTAPAFWSFDMALSRNFAIREKQHIEIRAEAFNLLNKFRPGTCNVLTSSCSFLANPYLGQVTISSGFTNLTNAGQFGRIISAMDPRIMQFALKYVF